MEVSALYISLILSFVVVESKPVNEMCTFSHTMGLCRGATGKFLLLHRPEVTTLFIINSDISYFTEDDFLYVRNLETLIIDSSKIPFPINGKNLFINLKNLITLMLVDCDLTHEGFDFLTNTNKLIKISFRRNKITHIRQGFLNNFAHLEYLDLSHNKIAMLEEGAFDDLPALVEVDLRRNRIGLQLDPSFLALPSGCSFCASSSGEERCPSDAAEKCHLDLGVDHLWRAFGGGDIVRLGGNPGCERTGDSPLFVEGSQETSLKEREGNNIGEAACQLRPPGSCYQHEQRRRFLVRACNEKIEAEDEHTTTTTTQDDLAEKVTTVVMLSYTQRQSITERRLAHQTTTLPVGDSEESQEHKVFHNNWANLLVGVGSVVISWACFLIYLVWSKKNADQAALTYLSTGIEAKEEGALLEQPE